MKQNTYDVPEIIRAIRQGGKARDRALKQLFSDKSIRAVVKKVQEEGGGEAFDFFPLFKDCIVFFDRYVRLFPGGSIDGVPEFFGKLARFKWGIMLKEDEGYRKGAIQFVAEDESLLRRLTAKVMNNGGREEDGENFYQQGFVKLHEQLNKGKYNGGAIRGYFFSTCYHLWLNSLKKHKPEPYEQVPEPEPDEKDDPFRQFEIKEFKMEFYKAFLKLNERCRNIITLKLFIRESFSMDEIAKMLGFKDGKAVAGALFKCRKKWKELL